MTRIEDKKFIDCKTTIRKFIVALENENEKLREKYIIANVELQKTLMSSHSICELKKCVENYGDKDVIKYMMDKNNSYIQMMKQLIK